MRIAQDYYEKGFSDYLLINEREILRQLLEIQSKKFVWKDEDKKNSLQTELVKTLPSWIRGIVWRAVALIFLVLAFYMLFLYIEKSASLFFAILVPFLFLGLSMIGSGYLYRKLIEPELKNRIKLQEDKIKALSE